uniref:HECT domain-containing protein n=1 Tax=Sparus aurata TaxID=8175 RepID=A0A671Y852_SPAAU
LAAINTHKPAFFWRDVSLNSQCVRQVTFSPLIHKGDDGFSTSMFPPANTCVNCIKLPLHVSYQLLEEKFDFASGNTYGFGRA